MRWFSLYPEPMDKEPSHHAPIMTLAPGYTLGGWLPAALATHDAVKALPSPVFDDPHARWMHEALVTAMAGVGLPSPNPNVGCVLVKDGVVLARGGTAKHGGLHGETQALSQLTHPATAQGATAYVTLEPCAHQGKQPPCADALLKAAIARCVYTALDPHPLVSGRGVARLREGGVVVEAGPLRHECMAWNLPFFFELAYKRPLVVGKWAQTLNGQMADQEGGSQWISGQLARRYVHWLRQKYDAILVGAGTALADGPELTARETWGPMRQPLKIVFDPSGRLSRIPFSALPEKVKMRTFAAGTKVVYVGPESPASRHWARESKADIFYIGAAEKARAFDTLLMTVTSPPFVAWHGTPLQSLFVEGGAALHNYLLAADLYDAFHVFVTPSFISAETHRVGYFGGGTLPQGFGHVATMKRYHLLQAAPLGPDVLMEFMPEDRWTRIFG